MSIYAIAELCGAISIISIGLFVFFSNKKSPANILFFLFCILSFFWMLGYTVCYTTQNPIVAQKFANLSCTSVALLAPMLYYFTVAYLGLRKEEKWAHLAFFLTIAQIPFFLLTNLFLEEPFHYYWGYYSNAGPLHPYHLAFWFTIFFRMYWLMLKHFLVQIKKSAEEANRVKYVVIAYLSLTIAAQDFLPKYHLEFFPFGFLFFIFFAICIGYSAFRHHLLDIRVAISRIAIFIAVYMVVTGVPFTLTLFGKERLMAAFSENWWMLPLGMTTLLASLSPFVFTYLSKRTENYLRRQLDQASYDELTGLLLRRMFIQKSTTALSMALQDRRPCSLLMIDLDHFKEKNDTYGHLVGDLLLVETAKRLSQMLRAEDIIGRYGGEEMVLLLPGADRDKAIEIAERLRKNVCATPMSMEDGTLLNQTVSIGVACSLENATDLQRLIAKADEALYTAKKGGRNRVEIVNA